MRFTGTITDGNGKHTELFVPGRNDLSSAPADWPVTLHPGSLNVRAAKDGYPDAFSALRYGLSVKNLDDGCVEPALIIPQDRLGNNKLTPTPAAPQKGTAQVWRATLSTEEQELSCWVLRRIGSALAEVLEIVAAMHLRTTYNLSSGQCVAVVLEPSDA